MAIWKHCTLQTLTYCGFEWSWFVMPDVRKENSIYCILYYLSIRCSEASIKQDPESSLGKHAFGKHSLHVGDGGNQPPKTQPQAQLPPDSTSSNITKFSESYTTISSSPSSGALVLAEPQQREAMWNKLGTVHLRSVRRTGNRTPVLTGLCAQTKPP